MHVARDEASSYASPILVLDGAAPADPDSLDAGVPWHFGDPLGESRAAERTAVVIDRSNRDVLTIRGEERLSWLNTLTSQHVQDLGDGESAEDLVLDVQGHVEQHFVVTALDDVAWLDTEPGRGAPLLDYLVKMVFWAKAEPTAADLAVLTVVGPDAAARLTDAGLPVPVEAYEARALDAADPAAGFVRAMPWPSPRGGAPQAPVVFDVVVPRERLRATFDALTTAGARPAGMWTFEALRAAALRPRLGIDTDERALPHELEWIGTPGEFGAVHLDKGCYRGQESVARIQNLGRPPRRLVLLQLDGSAEHRPVTGDEVTAGGRTVGRIGTVVDHYEDGPVALALIKRSVPVDTALQAGGVDASIDPDTYTDDDRVPPGRAAIERLRGR